jgi:ABC-type ATPase with predicted acetyltransferase domain
VIHRTSTPSRATRALAWFGLTAADIAHLRVQETRHARLLARRVIARRPGITLLVGPSGSGKSTVLDALARSLRRRTLAHVHTSMHAALHVSLPTSRTGAGAGSRSLPSVLDYAPEAPIVDIPRTTLPGAISLLSRVGLGEARLLALLPSELSDGQRARYRLALTLNDALQLRERHAHAWVLIDEFGTGLDRTTRRALALTLARFCAVRPGLHMVLSTTDDDVLERLAPDALIETRLGRRPRAHFRPSRARGRSEAGVASVRQRSHDANREAA